MIWILIILKDIISLTSTSNPSAPWTSPDPLSCRKLSRSKPVCSYRAVPRGDVVDVTVDAVCRWMFNAETRLVVGGRTAVQRHVGRRVRQLARSESFVHMQRYTHDSYRKQQQQQQSSSCSVSGRTGHLLFWSQESAILQALRLKVTAPTMGSDFVNSLNTNKLGWMTVCWQVSHLCMYPTA